MMLRWMFWNDRQRPRLEDADPLELAEIKRRWKPYIDQLPEYAYLCDELLKRPQVTHPPECQEHESASGTFFVAFL